MGLQSSVTAGQPYRVTGQTRAQIKNTGFDLKQYDNMGR